MTEALNALAASRPPPTTATSSCRPSLPGPPPPGRGGAVGRVPATACSRRRVLGYFARVLVESGRRVDGHELDPAAAEEARAVCEKVHEGDLQIFDADELDGPYQLMLFGDTLEHVPDPASVLRRLRSQLADDGHLVVSIPNIANWTVRLQLLFGRFRYTDRGILDRTHLRFYTVATLPEMLADAGFSVVKLQASVPVPGVTGEALARVAHRVGNLRPGFFGYNLIATCTKGS